MPSKWGDYKKYPWTMGWQPSYRTEAQIYTKYMLANVKKPKLAILYQNDDFGKDYPLGVRDVLGDGLGQDRRQVAELRNHRPHDRFADRRAAERSGANVLLVAGIPKFAAQAIRKVHDLNWKPMFFMTNVAISVGAVMQPAGPENAIGMISTQYLKDPTDPAWKDDAGHEGMAGVHGEVHPERRYRPMRPPCSPMASAMTMMQVLKQCNGDFSRANVMKQAENLHDLEIPVLLPGIKISTSPTDHRPIKAMQLQRWDGKTWVRFGDLIEGANV